MKHLSLFAMVLPPQAALAHPGDHQAASWTHLLSRSDHLGTVATCLFLRGAFLRGRS